MSLEGTLRLISELSTGPAWEEWRERAACRGMGNTQAGIRIFFLQNGDSPTPAKRICSRCPVQEECGDYARGNADAGIWNGTTIRQSGTPRPKPREVSGFGPVEDGTPVHVESSASTTGPKIPEQLVQGLIAAARQANG